MTSDKAIKMLQEHIDSLRHQTTSEGWKMLVDKRVVGPTMKDRLEFKIYAQNQIAAYEMAIDALRERHTS